MEPFRNILLVVQMFLWYSVIPEFVPLLKRWMIPTEPVYAQFISAALCPGLFTSAHISEQVRAGIQSLPRRKRLAAMALGFSPWHTYRHVLLPEAFRIIIPPLTRETMNPIKNSSIGRTIGLAELTFRLFEPKLRTGGRPGTTQTGRHQPDTDFLELPITHTFTFHYPSKSIKTSRLAAQVRVKFPHPIILI